MDDLKDRVALVTGASRGIGAATAEALARAGCNVAIGYNNSRKAAEEVAARIRETGRRVALIPADVSAHAAAETLVGTAEAELGGVDILINNAGINPVHGIDDLTLEAWQTTLQTNLTSSFMIAQRVIPGMRRRGWGRLVMMSSVAAQIGGVIGPHYAASKAGQLGLMRSYADLLAGTGITSNAIAPSARTRMTEEVFEDMMKKPESGFDAMAPENISPLVVWLGSSESKDVTGCIFELAGGEISLADGWRKGPAVDKGARWEPDEVGSAVQELVGKATPPQKVYGT